MVAFLAHHEGAVRAHHDIEGAIELGLLRRAVSKRGRAITREGADLTCGVDGANAVVVAVSDVHRPVRRHGEARRIVESRAWTQAIGNAWLSVAGQRRHRAIRVDAAYRVVVLVRHEQASARVRLDVVRLVESGGSASDVTATS